MTTAIKTGCPTWCAHATHSHDDWSWCPEPRDRQQSRLHTITLAALPDDGPSVELWTEEFRESYVTVETTAPAAYTYDVPAQRLSADELEDLGNMFLDAATRMRELLTEEAGR